MPHRSTTAEPCAVFPSAPPVSAFWMCAAMISEWPALSVEVHDAEPSEQTVHDAEPYAPPSTLPSYTWDRMLLRWAWNSWQVLGPVGERTGRAVVGAGVVRRGVVVVGSVLGGSVVGGVVVVCNIVVGSVVESAGTVVVDVDVDATVDVLAAVVFSRVDVTVRVDVGADVDVGVQVFVIRLRLDVKDSVAVTENVMVAVATSVVVVLGRVTLVVEVRVELLVCTSAPRGEAWGSAGPISAALGDIEVRAAALSESPCLKSRCCPDASADVLTTSNTRVGA